MMKPWVAVVACCGCASPSVDVFPDTSTISTTTTTTATAEPPGYESGTRLRARVYVGEDGSRAHVGFFDTERQENCSFSKASDDLLRCLPTNVYAQGYFSDAQCTTPLASATCGQAIAYARIPTGDTCAAWGPLRSIGAVYSGPMYAGSPANCVSTTAAPETIYYAIGAEVAPTEFVAATEQVE